MLLMRALRFSAVSVDVQRMIVNGEAAFGGDFFLAAFNFCVVKFFHAATLQAHQMVVVAALVELVNRLAAFEMVAYQQPGLFELGKDPIHGSKSDIHVFREKHAVYIFGGEMAYFALFEQVKNFQARQGGFESDVF